jgi:hypothetical protein
MQQLTVYWMLLHRGSFFVQFRSLQNLFILNSFSGVRKSASLYQRIYEELYTVLTEVHDANGFMYVYNKLN